MLHAKKLLATLVAAGTLALGLASGVTAGAPNGPKVGDVPPEISVPTEKDEDYYTANQVLSNAKKSLAGLEAADKASDKLKEYQQDKKISSAIKAGAIYEQAAALESQKKLKEALPLYAQAAKVGAGTKVGEKAKAKAQELAGKV